MAENIDFGSSTRIEKGNLIIEGIPQIPDRIRQGLARYQNVRSASLAGWLASGQGVVISTRFAETEQLHVVATAGGMRRQITFFDEPVASATVCPDPGTNRLLLTRDVGGGEFYQIFLLDLDTGECRMLTDGRSRHGAVRWSNRGDRFAFYTTGRNGRDHDLHVAGLDGRSRPVLQREGLWEVLDWAPADDRLLVRKYVSINECYLYILELADGRLTELMPSDEHVAYGKALFTRDGGGVFFSSDADNEFLRLGHVDLAGGAVRIVAEFGWNVDDLALSHNGTVLALTTNEDGYSRLHLLDTASGAERPVPAVPEGLIGHLQFSPDDTRLALMLAMPRAPGDVFVLDFAAGDLTQWTFSETAGLPAERFAAPELIHYPTFDLIDGCPRRIPAFYYRPAGPGPHPVLIQIHGGPEGQSRPGFSAAIQYWVGEMGMAVLVPNVRGSAGYGKTFLLLDNGRLREDSVRDIGALLDWIAGRRELDAGRVAVTGGSYGGYMVLACMTHYNDRLRAGVEIVGIANWVTFLENTQAYRRDLRRAEYGDERDPAMREFLLQVSPVTNVKKITRPMLIAQGLNDPRVPASESEQMVSVIRAAGGTVAYILATDEGHGFRKKSNRDYYDQATVLFLERFLL
ncbi:MAG: S9 family peptidase [Planctomycetes bacterium]|nr:S9 family peptidase [Planctomycetota bacterium]